MEIIVERAALLEAVNHLSRIVNNKTSLPVLEGIYFSAEQGKLTLISYNLEMGIKKEIYSNTAQPGEIVINARILAEILRKMNGVSVEISTDERLMCHIKSGTANFDIMGMAGADFPEMPSVINDTPIKIGGEILKNMVRRTIFAVAQNEGTRPILTGIKVSIKNDNIQTVLTNNTDTVYKKFNYKLTVYDKTDESDIKTYVIYYNEEYALLNQNSIIFGVLVEGYKE